MLSRITRQTQLLPGGSTILSVVALFLFVFVLSSGRALAEPSEWWGVYEYPEDEVVRIDLSIGEDDNYSMHYGEPRSCRMELEELPTPNDDKILLKVKETSGGFCDDRFQAQLTITKDDGDSWTAVIKKKSIDFEEIYHLFKKK